MTLRACAKSYKTHLSFFMAKENDKVDDIEIPDEINLGELDDTTDWKLKADELQKAHREAGIRNRERTKALKEKIAELEKAKIPEKKDKKEDKQPNEFGLLEKAFLKSSGITDSEEIELARKYYEDFGGKKQLDEIVEHPFFKAEIDKMRTAKTNATATANLKGEGGDAGKMKEDPDYWLSKATKNSEGELMFPEELPKDFKLRAAIVDKFTDSSKSNKKFYNS